MSRTRSMPCTSPHSVRARSLLPFVAARGGRHDSSEEGSQPALRSPSIPASPPQSRAGALKIRADLLPGQPAAGGAADSAPKPGSAAAGVQSLFRGQQQASPSPAPETFAEETSASTPRQPPEETAAELQRRLDAFRQVGFDEARFSQLVRPERAARAAFPLPLLSFQRHERKS